MEVKILMKNSEQAFLKFKEFKKMLQDEEAFYQSKAKQYGNRWRVQPSNQLNRQYYNEIEGNYSSTQSLRKNTRSPTPSIARLLRSTKASLNS